MNTYCLNPKLISEVVVEEAEDIVEIANPFRYCGEYFDNETETLYLRERYYNIIKTYLSSKTKPNFEGTIWGLFS